MKQATRVIPVAVAFCWPFAANAIPATQDQIAAAQGEINRRVSTAVVGYAKAIGLGEIDLLYCNIEMEFKTDQRPGGSIPFGVDFNRMSAETLAQIVRERVAYETVFQMLCLANVKTTLKAAEH